MKMEFSLSSPNRHRWGFFDVVAVSPKGRSTAEKIMERSLKAIWGEEKTTEFLQAIYHPHPQFEPVTDEPIPYLLTLPKNYFDKKNVTKRWPLVLSLHGLDERGNDLMQIRKHGIPKVVLDNPNFQFIGICPQQALDKEVC
jgi:predicted peptidase